jgi:protein-L-isoaspartate(D-aspartate) O-methyltransferase
MVALMTQLLDLKGEEKVLEIGTGSGYQAAILAELAKTVYSIERITSLSEKAQKVLSELGYTNISIKVDDGTLGWQEFSPFDAIIVTAASPEIPQSLIKQLAEGGRLTIPVGGAFGQMLVLVNKHKGKVETKEICGCVFVPLIGKYGYNK